MPGSKDSSAEYGVATGRKGEAKRYLAYCLKCHEKVEPANGQYITKSTRRGNHQKVAMWTGECPVCGTKVFRIIGRA